MKLYKTEDNNKNVCRDKIKKNGENEKNAWWRNQFKILKYASRLWLFASLKTKVWSDSSHKDSGLEIV